MRIDVRVRPLTALLLVLAAIGCQGASPTESTQPASMPPIEASESFATPDALAGNFTLRLDLATASGEIEPIQIAASQPPQNLQYDLDLSKFVTTRVLEVTGISFDANGDVVVGIRHRHPFAAPDVSQPATAINRADLGYTGRLLVLAQGAARLFYGGAVQVDPALVIDADGYINPGSLLKNSVPVTHNTFPYLLLADEAKDNRLGISNGGIPTGNHDPADGWQAATLGQNGTGWYGYDYLHAGQEVDLQLVLRRSSLATETRIGLALLIKYTDPKGSNAKSDRFPAVPPDLTRFVYRLPYAALDVSAMKLTNTLVLDDVGGSTPVNVSLRDWDAQATASTDHDLSDEPDPRAVQPGASGAPVVELDAPQIGEITPLLAVGGNGIPGNEMQYEGAFANTNNAGPGTYLGLLRATDPEDGDALALDYRFGLDPNTLAPDPGRALRVRTYQSVQLSVRFTGPEVISVAPIGTIGNLGQPVQFSAVATNSPSEWAWNFGGGTIPNTSGDASPQVVLLTPGTYEGSLVVSNAAGTSSPFTFGYTINIQDGPGWALTWGGGFTDHGNDVQVSPAGDIFLAGSISWNGEVNDPVDVDPTGGVEDRILNGWADAYVVRLGPDGSYRWSIGVGADRDEDFNWVDRDTAHAIALDWSRNALYIVGQYAGQVVDFDPGPGQAGSATPFRTNWSYLAKYDLDGNFQWVRNWGHPDTYHTEDGATRVVLDGAGNPYVIGYTVPGTDLDPGPGEFIAPAPAFYYTYLSRFDAGGTRQWTRLWESYWESPGLTVGPAGVTLCGAYRIDLDLDPGTGTDLHTTDGQTSAFLVNLDLNGNFVWGKDWGPTTTGGSAQAYAVERDSAGRLAVAGAFRGPAVDMAPGAGQHLIDAHFRGDAFLLALTDDGNFRWVDRWSQFYNAQTDSGRDIAIDVQSNIIVVGTTGPDDDQATVRKYSVNGTLDWNRDWGGLDFDLAEGVAIIDGTSMVISGDYDIGADFGFGGSPDIRTPGSDMFLVRLKPDGTR